MVHTARGLNNDVQTLSIIKVSASVTSIADRSVVLMKHIRQNSVQRLRNLRHISHAIIQVVLNNIKQKCN